MFYSAKDYSVSDLTHYIRLYMEDGVLKVCCMRYIKTVQVVHMYFHRCQHQRTKKRDRGDKKA